MEPGRPRTGRRLAVLLALLAAAVFAAAATPNLLGQGAQGDELHQAPAAFWHLDRPCPIGCAASIGGMPLLTMSYSGALKSHVYGLVLRLRRHFDLGDWRLLGIALTALGLGLMVWLLRAQLGPVALLTLLLLSVSDASVLLLGRFDFGPFAFAFLLRVLFAAAMVRCLESRVRQRPAPGAGFGLGLAFGLGLYEKLSNVALAPAFLVAWTDLRGRRSRALALAGAALGSAPLALANAQSWWARGELVSLSGTADPYPMAAPSAVSILGEALRLGQAGPLAEAILGLARRAGLEQLETALWGILVLVGLGAAALRGRSASFELRAAARLVFAGLAALAVLALLPRTTHPWHWALWLPFPYLAAAYLLEARRQAAPAVRRRTLAPILAAVLALAAVRSARQLEIRSALAAGRASPSWSPELTEFARWAAAQPDDVLFVTTDWGVAEPIFSFADGRPHRLWSALFDRHGPGHAAVLASRWHKRRLYLVRLREIGPARPERVAALERGIAQDPYWTEIPLPGGARGWRALHLRAFRAAAELPVQDSGSTSGTGRRDPGPGPAGSGGQLEVGARQAGVGGQ